MPPAAWTREHEREHHETYAVKLADIVDAFQIDDIVAYTTARDVNESETEVTQNDQDEIIAGQSTDEASDSEYPVPPQGGSDTTVDEIFMRVITDQEQVQTNDVGTATLDTQEETDEETE